MPRVIHFEMHVKRPDRAARFYAEAFGWLTHPCGGPDDYWVLSTGPDTEAGIDGGVMHARDNAPRIVNTIAVESIDDSIERIVANGGEIVVPKTAVPGVGYNAYFKDTEGNCFGLHQSDAEAE